MAQKNSLVTVEILESHSKASQSLVIYQEDCWENLNNWKNAVLFIVSRLSFLNGFSIHSFNIKAMSVLWKWENYVFPPKLVTILWHENQRQRKIKLSKQQTGFLSENCLLPSSTKTFRCRFYSEQKAACHEKVLRTQRLFVTLVDSELVG